MPHVVESWQTSYSKRNRTQDHTDLAGFMQAALAILLIWEGFFFFSLLSYFADDDMMNTYVTEIRHF